MKRLKFICILSVCLVFSFIITKSQAQEASFEMGEHLVENLVGHEIESVCTADLDGDGDQDAIYASLGTDQIGWYANDGQGQFDNLQIITSDVIDPKEIYTADLDGDGDQDLLSASYDDDKIAWYENDGLGNFSPQQIIATIFRAEVVLAADLDGDGDLDVLAGSGASPVGKIAWYENDGSGNFINEQIITTATVKLEDLEVVDLDGDGDPDILSASFYDDKIAWYSNDGTGIFSSQQVLTVAANGAKSVCTADFDGDGDLDIACASYTAKKIEYLENYGMGIFGSLQTLSLYKKGVVKVFPSDFDNDGDMDLLYTSDIQKIGGWVLNNGNFSFNTHGINYSGFKDFFLSDINGDGSLEILALANYTYNISSSSFYWLDAAIPTTSVAVNYIATSYARWRNPLARDIDNDGDMDIILAIDTYDDYGERLVLYKNNGNNLNNLTEEILIDSTLATGNFSYGIGEFDLVDLSGDGFLDILLYDYAIWYENDGSGNFPLAQDIFTGTSQYELYDIETGDVDNDGDIDVLIRRQNDINNPPYTNNRSIFLYRNDGLGIFAAPIEVWNNGSGESYGLADMDGDGDLDCLYENCFDYPEFCIESIFWAENMGNGMFGDSHFAGAFDNQNLENVEIKDIDGDGDLDILPRHDDSNGITTFSYWYITWLENDGNGGFTKHELQNTNTSVTHVGFQSLADLEGDGDLDIFFSYRIGAAYKTAFYINDGNGIFSDEFYSISESDGYSFITTDFNNDEDVTLFYYEPEAAGVKWLEFSDLAWDGEICVDATATGDNSGRGWLNAYTDLQDALAVGTDTTIHIAEGTYLPTNTGTRGISFDIPSGNTLLGGYPSGGGTRSPETYETILSGNVDNNVSITGDSYHVVTIINAMDVEIDGLTIREGNADNANSYARSRAGGVYINNSTVEFQDVDFKWNRGIYGGALFAKFSDVTIRQSTFKKNRADYGSAMYYSNATNLNLLRSEVVDNTSNVRCAIESNNASVTQINNSLIANNKSTDANALGIIATNRDAIVQIRNTTILGEADNKNLITYQIGNNDQLDVTIHNSIIAHQNASFDKNMIAYNNNIFNLDHSHCYFSGSSVIGNGTNTLFANLDGGLSLNNDYTVDECSPVIDAGDDALGVGVQDYFGNLRYYNNIDIGAYEAQNACMNPREMQDELSEETDSFSIYPNPTNANIVVKTDLENPTIIVGDMMGRQLIKTTNKEINISQLAQGMYWIHLFSDGEDQGKRKVLKL